MAKKKERKKEEGAAAWMVTFSDMTTLLMVFFVMLIAAGDVKIVKTRIILSAFDGKLGLLKGGKSISPGDFENVGQTIESLPSNQKAKSLSRSFEKAVSIFQPEIKSKKVRVTENERGVIISLMSDVFFEGKSAKIDYESVKSTLENLKLLMSNSDFTHQVQIEGHTDNNPYVGDDFKDNWDLSVERAWSILNALKLIPSLHAFDESKVSIHGYGSVKPIEDNTTPEGQAYNRRVDLVFTRKN